MKSFWIFFSAFLLQHPELVLLGVNISVTTRHSWRGEHGDVAQIIVTVVTNREIDILHSGVAFGDKRMYRYLIQYVLSSGIRNGFKKSPYGGTLSLLEQGVKSLLYHTSLTDLMLLATSKMNLVNDVLS